LVAACLGRGINVSPIPGPSAVTAALSASGLPADQYVFLGFPPASGQVRRRWFEDLASQTRTSVFFEAPHRVRRTLAEAGLLLVERQIFAFREITKIYEELVVLQTNAKSQNIVETGEFTLVVSGQLADRSSDLDGGSALDLYSKLTKGQPFSREEAVSLIATKLQAEPSEVAKSIKKAKILADRQNIPTP
jgi:16S rRNA (cytidine1402-2'-O)-methyltransferase